MTLNLINGQSIQEWRVLNPDLLCQIRNLKRQVLKHQDIANEAAEIFGSVITQSLNVVSQSVHTNVHNVRKLQLTKERSVYK